MKTLDLTQLSWRVSGWTPEMWRLATSMELGSASKPEIEQIPCRVPGSVQGALKASGLLPDWNIGLNSRACEWVENRHWIFETTLPASDGPLHLKFEGLDGSGEIWIDHQAVMKFNNSFLRYEVEVTGLLHADSPRRLMVVFFCPPRWLGQTGFTSLIRDWKPRFNYTWDWMPRNVQIGIFGTAQLYCGELPRLDRATIQAGLDGTDGTVHLGDLPEDIAVTLRVLNPQGTLIAERENAGSSCELRLPCVSLWQPNGNGVPALYTIEILVAEDRRLVQIGFRSIEWLPCEGAASDADPWICRINGRDTFLQGINWTPIRPHFADLRREDYELRLRTYRDLGFNCIRIWGGGFAEHEWLYELCDSLGLLVWQDFPLSSSGICNWPPEDPDVIDEARTIATAMVRRLRHHASVFLWCGGNELQGALDGCKQGIGKPASNEHPMLAMFADIVRELDPGNRYVATTSSGPRFVAQGADFGKNLHWDVHGPWNVAKVDLTPWQDYWRQDDALFRSEMGNAGAQSTDLIRRYLGECDFQRATLANPYWQRVSFWFELDEFLSTRDGQSWEIEDYVEWSQARQTENLTLAVRTFKSRFPRCGGFILWMGHDSFPCPVNTSILDFEGRPKPVCAAMTEVLKQPTGRRCY